MKTNEEASASMARIAELTEMMVGAHFGDTAGFVLMISYDREDGTEGCSVRVATNLCDEHAARTMVGVGNDFAERHGVLIPDPPLTALESTDRVEA